MGRELARADIIIHITFIVMLIAAGVILWWVFAGGINEAVPKPEPEPAPLPAAQVETTLHDAGEGITCWVMRRGDEILDQGCFR